MIDDVVSILNIILISLSLGAVVIWSPVALKAVKRLMRREIPGQIYSVGLGIVLVCSSVAMVRGYSFALREHDMIWLRDTWLPPILIGYMAVGFAVFFGGYFVHRESGVRSAGDKDFAMASIFVSIAAFFVMIVLKGAD